MPDAEVCSPKDLAVLVPDCNYEEGIQALLGRPRALGIADVSFDIYTHMHRDPGCLRQAHDFLRPFIGEYRFAMVLFDREGCGSDAARSAIESSVQDRLERNGWPGRCRVLVVDPEFDVWVWSDSPHVPDALGWPREYGDLRAWLDNCQFATDGGSKPSRPKEAMEAVLRVAHKPRSASIYALLGKQVSVERCTDPAFSAFKETLRDWFPFSR